MSRLLSRGQVNVDDDVAGLSVEDLLVFAKSPEMRDELKRRGIVDPSGISAEALKKLLPSLIQRFRGLERSTAKQWQRHVSESYRIVCFSRDPVQNLMWAHYGDSHRGVAIIIRGDLIPRSDYGALLNITYSDTPVSINPFAPSTDPDRASRLMASIFRKSNIWAYESEVRWLVPIQELKSTPRNNDLLLAAVPPETMSGIVFGVATPEEDRAKACFQIGRSQSNIAAKCRNARKVTSSFSYRVPRRLRRFRR